MKRVRRFSLSVEPGRCDQAAKSILQTKSGKIRSLHTLPGYASILASVERDDWPIVEDQIAPVFSLHWGKTGVGYTEVCVYSKREMDGADYYVVLFKSDDLDLTQRYHFAEYDESGKARPRVWFAGKVEGSAQNIQRQSASILHAPGGLVASPDDFARMYPDELRGVHFDPITDLSTGLSTGWASWWPLHSLPEFEPETTGVVVSGLAPLGVAGGGAARCDCMESGFSPVYKRSTIRELTERGVHVARTRECYGIWPTEAENVKVAPQPRLVVSKRFRSVVSSAHKRKMIFIPIFATG